MAALGTGASLPDWQVRVLDCNYLPASEKHLAPLRGFRGAALPGQSPVVYVLDSAQPGDLWIADRHFCTRMVLEGWQDARAAFIVREHGRHSRLTGQGEWQGWGRVETGQVREQAIEVTDQQPSWRRIELAFDAPTEAGETTIRLWSNLSVELVPGESPNCITRGGALRACPGGWKACWIAKWPALAIHARRRWALRFRCWPTTFSPCSPAG